MKSELTMQPIEIKDIKKGDIFYERGTWDWYKMTALEDAYCSGDVEINKKTYKQYSVKVETEFADSFNVLVTEGLEHYCAKYYK